MNRDELKTPDSLFTFGEIDDFCKEWGWIHVTDFIKQTSWINDHKPPYIWSTYGQGQFLGIDGNKYMTWGTYRTQWIGDVKNDPAEKEEFRKFLKIIAGDYYWKGKREHYYFYDVLLRGGGPYDCYEIQKYEPKYVPNEEALKYHGKPYWNVVLWHMGVSYGRMWGYIHEDRKFGIITSNDEFWQNQKQKFVEESKEKKISVVKDDLKLIEFSDGHQIKRLNTNDLECNMKGWEFDEFVIDTADKLTEDQEKLIKSHKKYECVKITRI